MMLAMEFSNFFDIVAIPFGYVMQFFNWVCGGHYALALLLFALLVKLVTLPIGIRQQKSQIKLAKLRPKMLMIEKKYAGRNDRTTLQKKQQEMMELQQKEGYSPFAGCLPLLIQLPVLFGLYRIIRMPLKYVCNLADDLVIQLCNNAQLTVDGVLQVFDSSKSVSKTENYQIDIVELLRQFPERLGDILPLEKLPEFDLFGVIDLAQKPSSVFNIGDDKIQLWLIAIPVINGIFAYLSMWISRKMNDNGLNNPAAGDQKLSMTIMNLTMPLMSVWIAFITPGVIGLYWIYTSVLGIIQTLLFAKFMPLPKYTDEEIKEMQRAMKNNKNERTIVGTSVDENGKPKSLHYEDDDDY